MCCFANSLSTSFVRNEVSLDVPVNWLFYRRLHRGWRRGHQGMRSRNFSALLPNNWRSFCFYTRFGSQSRLLCRSGNQVQRTRPPPRFAPTPQRQHLQGRCQQKLLRHKISLSCAPFEEVLRFTMEPRARLIFFVPSQYHFCSLHGKCGPCDHRRSPATSTFRTQLSIAVSRVNRIF